MQTEYSADDIATAKGLQFLAYICISMATFWTYDYAFSLHEEWTFLLRSRWTKVKGLYIITRYVPFLLLITDLHLYFTPNENPDQCRIVIGIYSCLSVISVACSECFFVLRTYALWNNNRIVLAVMSSAFFGTVVASVSVDFTTVDASHITISPIPTIKGCYQASTSHQISISFLLLFIFQLGLVSLTIIRVMQSWRTINSSLYDILVKHNIFYYACGLLLSLVNVTTQMTFSQTAYRLVCEVPQFFILAILATRMHLYLWQLDRHTHGSALVHIPMSEMLPADYTVTTV